jgi:hypothetical protein
MKQNMVQTLNVIVALPGLIAEQVSTYDKKWQTFLLLRELTLFLMAESIHTRQLSQLRELIADFLRSYKESFKDHLTFKFHLLTHYPFIIRQVGPIRHFMALRLEGKHRTFKKLAVASNNFKNICLTLSKRHQIAFAYRCLSNRGISEDRIEDIGKSIRRDIGSVPNIKQSYRDKYFPDNSTAISITKKVSINGVGFTTKKLIYLGMPIDGLFPVFFRISSIILNGSIVYFTGHYLVISGVDEHLQAFIVESDTIPSELKLVTRSQMRSPWCFQLRKQYRTNQLFIALHSNLN